MKKNYFLIVIYAFLFLLTACHEQTKVEILRVGTISGPETELMQVAANVAKEKGVTVRIIEFSDYAMPNTALSEGSLDANMFQHEPYLKNTLKQRQYDLAIATKTFIYPMGIYSKKIRTLKTLPDGAIVAIPNDPTNEARALLLLQKAKLITLKPNADDNATLQSILSNPKHLQIKEMDAAGLARVLDDTTLAVINTNYAIPAGLIPSKDALFLEDKHSPYANLLVVKTQNLSDPKIQVLINALHSNEVKEKAKILFRGEAIPAW